MYITPHDVGGSNISKTKMTKSIINASCMIIRKDRVRYRANCPLSYKKKILNTSKAIDILLSILSI